MRGALQGACAAAGILLVVLLRLLDQTGGSFESRQGLALIFTGSKAGSPVCSTQHYRA